MSENVKHFPISTESLIRVMLKLTNKQLDECLSDMRKKWPETNWEPLENGVAWIKHYRESGEL